MALLREFMEKKAQRELLSKSGWMTQIIQIEIMNSVMELLETFRKQEHSGASASMVSSLFKDLVDGKVLTALTGEDDEWIQVSEGLEQNKRCFQVFRNSEGAYDINGRVFEHSDGWVGTCSESHSPVTFPYTPGGY